MMNIAQIMEKMIAFSEYQPRSGPLQVVCSAGSQRKYLPQQPCSGIFECVSGRSGE